MAKVKKPAKQQPKSVKKTVSAKKTSTKTEKKKVLKEEELEIDAELIEDFDFEEKAIKLTRRSKKLALVEDDILDETEIDANQLDAEKFAAEVEQKEGGEENAEEESDANLESADPLPSFVGDEDDAALDADAVLPSMEGMSILRETELNDVINDVKHRSEANGGYITYEELNQILPSNIVDAIQSDRYLKILEALGVQVLREEDVKKFVEAKNQKTAKSHPSEIITRLPCPLLSPGVCSNSCPLSG